MKVKSEKIDQERKNILQWSVVTFRADENQSNASENQKVDRQLPRRIANAGRRFVLSLALPKENPHTYLRPPSSNRASLIRLRSQHPNRSLSWPFDRIQPHFAHIACDEDTTSPLSLIFRVSSCHLFFASQQ